MEERDRRRLTNVDLPTLSPTEKEREREREKERKAKREREREREREDLLSYSSLLAGITLPSQLPNPTL